MFEKWHESRQKIYSLEKHIYIYRFVFKLVSSSATIVSNGTSTKFCIYLILKESNYDMSLSNIYRYEYMEKGSNYQIKDTMYCSCFEAI